MTGSYLHRGKLIMPIFCCSMWKTLFRVFGWFAGSHKGSRTGILCCFQLYHYFCLSSPLLHSAIEASLQVKRTLLTHQPEKNTIYSSVQVTPGATGVQVTPHAVIYIMQYPLPSSLPVFNLPPTLAASFPSILPRDAVKAVFQQLTLYVCPVPLFTGLSPAKTLSSNLSHLTSSLSILTVSHSWENDQMFPSNQSINK